MNLYFLLFGRAEQFAGGLYVWARDGRGALEQAEYIGPPEGWTHHVSEAIDPRLVPFLPVGFLGRILSRAECEDAERAMLEAQRERRAKAMAAGA